MSDLCCSLSQSGCCVFERHGERSADLVWGDDELEVEQVVLVGEHDLTRLWQVQLINV